ncbi:hypothetical protein EDB83DRAFT_2516383 [Lactarius deliciosus]|nr:hypothetical protein EDB83DRAFT_2516383 [Lactarius deliciosus]
MRSPRLGEGVGLLKLKRLTHLQSAPSFFADILARKVISAGPGVLLLEVESSQEALADVFEGIENFFKRLESYTEASQTEAMTDIIVKIMVEVLDIFAIATEEMK